MEDLILIVDDELINIKIAEKILQNAGYDTISTTQGTEALELAVQKKPDLILLDIMMPDIDGFEVCENLASFPETRDIPIIFLTALHDKANIVKGFEVGARDHLSKPFHKEEFLARIKTHVQLKKLIEKQANLVKELKKALDEIKQLSGLIPICSHCKKIRDDKGYWLKVEQYIQKNSNCEFSHGICPDCMEKYYPKIAEKLRNKKEKEE